MYLLSSRSIAGRKGERACEYHTMPSMAVAMPRNFLSGISSPKNTQPPVRMITVLMWPTTLYVRLEVAPITCNDGRKLRS